MPTSQAAAHFPARVQALASVVTAPAPKDTQRGPVPPQEAPGRDQAREASLPDHLPKPLEASYHWWGMQANGRHVEMEVTSPKLLKPVKWPLQAGSRGN